MADDDLYIRKALLYLCDAVEEVGKHGKSLALDDLISSARAEAMKIRASGDSKRGVANHIAEALNRGERIDELNREDR